MQNDSTIEKQSDSLIELLTAQCADLENLLSLAREETTAAKQGNFAKIIDIYSERSELNNRLETFQQQINELRETLGKAVPNEISTRVKEVVNLTLAQDRETRLLLTSSKEDAIAKLNNLENSKKKTDVYMSKTKKGLAYDKTF